MARSLFEHKTARNAVCGRMVAVKGCSIAMAAQNHGIASGMEPWPMTDACV